jgi:acetolactate synthase small subunit
MDALDGKTKSMVGLLERLNVSSSALVVTLGTDHNLVQAASNLKKIYTLPVNQLNAEALLSRELVILTVEAAKWAEESFAIEPHGRRGRKFATANGTDADTAVVADAEVTEEESVSAETVSESDTHINENEDGE